MLQTFPFQQQLIRSWPPETWRDVTVLVAVSGGADSVALLRGLTAVLAPGSGQLIAAHYNHGMRGEHALADEAFVVDLCQDLGVPCEVGRADRGASVVEETGVTANGDASASAGPPRSTMSSEAALRRARYRFLTDTARRLGARYVATGHTADDQAETVLHRIVRGTGIAGLAGIRRYRELVPGVSLVRPLLDISRRQVREYLEALAQTACEDGSNADLTFTRNRIRHELLPQLAAQYNARVGDAVLRLASLAADVQQVVTNLVEDLYDRCVKHDSPVQVSLDCRELGGVPHYLARELLVTVWRHRRWPLRAMGYQRWEQLADLVGTPPIGPWKQVFPGSIVAERQGPWLRLFRDRSGLFFPGEPTEHAESGGAKDEHDVHEHIGLFERRHPGRRRQIPQENNEQDSGNG